jgi:hypothetical protein
MIRVQKPQLPFNRRLAEAARPAREQGSDGRHKITSASKIVEQAKLSIRPKQPIEQAAAQALDAQALEAEVRAWMAGKSDSRRSVTDSGVPVVRRRRMQRSPQPR